MKYLQFEDIGLMRYKPCWDYQEEIFKNVISQKISRRDGLDKKGNEASPYPTSRLLFVEHPHVLTLGRSGDAENVIVSPARLAELGVDYFPTNRGGDITYHGPGQLVAYPILDLDQFFTDIHKYLRFLEEAVIKTCAEFGVEAGRIDGLTGVWVDIEAGPEARKICAFGVKASRWVTMHGFALNVRPDMSYFNGMIPCGIQGKGVVSMKELLGTEITIEAVSQPLVKAFQAVFEFDNIID